MIQRAILILTAVVLATAAPLRAWCEAGCLAPAHTENTTASSHCKTAGTDSNTTAMSARVTADCPIVESARPVTAAKIAFAPAIVPQHPSTAAPLRLRTAPRHPGTKAPRHPGLVPLRI